MVAQQQATLHSTPSFKKSIKLSSSTTTPTDKVKQQTIIDPQLSSSASKSKRLLAFLHTTPTSSSDTKMSLLSDSINISGDEKNTSNVVIKPINGVLQPHNNNHDNNNDNDDDNIKIRNTDVYNKDTVSINENKRIDNNNNNDKDNTRNEVRYDRDAIIIEDSSWMVHPPYIYNEMEIFLSNSKLFLDYFYVLYN